VLMGPFLFILNERNSSLRNRAIQCLAILLH
jgi:hypothetical protein